MACRVITPHLEAVCDWLGEEALAILFWLSSKINECMHSQHINIDDDIIFLPRNDLLCVKYELISHFVSTGITSTQVTIFMRRVSMPLANLADKFAY